MTVTAETATLEGIEPLRELHRQTAHCQIIQDSAIPRGAAHIVKLLAGEKVIGYGGMWTRYNPSRICEFFVLPDAIHHAKAAYRALLELTEATEIGAQTNMPIENEMLRSFAVDIEPERILFKDAGPTHIAALPGLFRRATGAEVHYDATSEFVIELNDVVIAHGGYLSHYNPPYVDLFMGVEPEFQRRGYGSFIVQEIKRAAIAAGKIPAARCNYSNDGSKQTLLRAGMEICGELLVGKVRTPLS